MIEDIKRAFELVGNLRNAKVLELGCADGSDAKEIIKRTTNYVGMDIAEDFIEIARQDVPEGDFEVADINDFKFPDELDIIFAFASLVHATKEEVGLVFQKARASLKHNGIFYLTLKYSPEYEEYIKNDGHGQRQFYRYNAELIKQLAGAGFEVVYEDIRFVIDTDWLRMALRKA
jgi:SAM-dependent methyltransferase